MDDKYDPMHPAVRMKNRGSDKVNAGVINLPNMGVRKFRIHKNNMLDAVLGPVKVTYNEEQPTRSEHFETGSTEHEGPDATVSHINKGREIKYRKSKGK